MGGRERRKEGREEEGEREGDSARERENKKKRECVPRNLGGLRFTAADAIFEY